MRASSMLGFTWDKHCVPIVVPTHPVEKTCFRLYRVIPDFIADVCTLEGKPVSTSEVAAVLDGGIDADRQPRLNSRVHRLARGFKYLMAIVRTDRFAIDSAVLGAICHVITNDQPFAAALTRSQAELYASEVWDDYPQAVTRADASTHTLIPNGGASIFRDLQKIQNDIASPFEKAMAVLLLCNLCDLQSHDASAATMLMMNGVLLQAGVNAISISASRTGEFRKTLARFRVSKDGSEVISLVLDCHPAAAEIYAANPHLSVRRPLRPRRSVVRA